MAREFTRYTNVVRKSQEEWQDKRARGWSSLTRKHQTIELPIELAARYQNSLIDAMPIDSSIKSDLKRNHPTLVMGWALGPDDREVESDQNERKNHILVGNPKRLDQKQFGNYWNGFFWVNEVITGRATGEVMSALKKKPLDSKVGL